MARLFSGSYDNSQFHKLIKDRITVFHIVLGVSVCDGLQYLGLIRNKLARSTRFLRGTVSRVLVGASQSTAVYLLVSTGELHLNIAMPLFISSAHLHKCECL